MGRLSTIGFEIEAISGLFDGLNVTGAATRDATVSRPGGGANVAASLKCDSGAGNAAASASLANQCLGTGAGGGQFVATTTYSKRFYFCFDDLPTSDTDILRYVSTTAITVRLRTTGALALYNATAGTQIGSDSTLIVVADGVTWYRIDLSVIRSATPTITFAEARVNQQIIATSGVLALTASSVNGATAVGWITAPGANKVLHVDDGAINDSTGTHENTYPDEGNVLLLLEVSDNARSAGWLAGAGGTTNLFDAGNNMPPVGVALASATNTSQIKNGAATTTDNYDANLTDYTTAGVDPMDTITLVHPLWALGCDSATATNIARLLVSNPQSNGGTESTQSTGAIAGTYNSNWKQPNNGLHIVYNPTVVLGTSPVIRVGKRTNTAARTVMCCFMGAYVEVKREILRPILTVEQAVNRAAAF
jgi:hypothetical protein